MNAYKVTKFTDQLEIIYRYSMKDIWQESLKLKNSKKVDKQFEKNLENGG